MGEQRERTPPPSRGRLRRLRGTVSPLEGLIVLAGAFLSATVVVVTHAQLEEVARDLPMAVASHEIATQVALAHVSLVEVGDRAVRPDVNSRLDRADAACARLLDAGRGGHLGARGVSQVAVLCRDIDDLRVLSDALLAAPADGTGDSLARRRFESAFTSLIGQNEKVHDQIAELTDEHHQEEKAVYRIRAATPLVAAGVIGFLVRRNRRRLQESTERVGLLAAIVNSSPDAIVSNTPDGVITSWNYGAERLFGWTEDEIVGRDVRVLLAEQRRDPEVLDKVRRGEQITRESVRLHKDGTLIPVSLTLAPIYEDGVMTGLASIQRDMTERHAKDAALAAAREEALEASRLKSEFLATMSHEIRTPMNGVVGLTSLLLETPLNDLQRQYAEGVRGAGEALLTVINDILDFSKLEAGKVELESTRFDPRRLVEEVATLLAPAAQVKGLELITFCAPEVPVGLLGDPGRIRQILLNLASNAVKFTPAGEVAITVRSETLEVGTVRVRVEVSDTGIGVGTGDADRLFDSFTQADASTTRKFGGTGLGLAISRHLVDLMGGEIGVQSRVGGGSSFWVQLPLCTSDDIGPHDAPVGPHELLDGVRVLVVEGNATSRAALEAHLADRGARPHAVETGAAAWDELSRATRHADPYAVVVVSARLPDMDGLELARRVSAPGSAERPSVLLLTPSPTAVPHDLAAAGVHGWLTKPVRTNDLRTRLLQMVAPAAAADASTAPGRQEPDLQGQRRRVLVVEDNELNQMVAEGMVASLGYDVDVAANGAEAIDAVANGTHAAVLMDCHMPVMDGFEATLEIRRRTTDGRIPIIAMTAAAMVEDRDRCIEAGMDDYISKPVTVQDMEAVLARWVVDGDS